MTLPLGDRCSTTCTFAYTPPVAEWMTKCSMSVSGIRSLPSGSRNLPPDQSAPERRSRSRRHR